MIIKNSVGVGKMYFVKDKKIIIVDTVCFTTKEDYIKLFTEAEVSPEDVSLIVITHSH